MTTKERETRDLHGCPRLVRPITPTRLRHELQTVLGAAGLAHRRATVAFPNSLAKEHLLDHRRYAQVIPSRMRFEFAMAFLWLPRRYRVALYAHEVGHVLDPILPKCDTSSGVCSHGAIERRADRMAMEKLGIRIGYDRTWSGKGLQVLVGRGRVPVRLPAARLDPFHSYIVDHPLPS